MNNPAHSMADVLGLPAEYRGMSPVGQHMFSNGSPLVTHVFTHLDEALKRFGKRIKIEDRFYKFSAGYRAGMDSATYAPRAGAGKQELMEYGLGYLRRKLDEMDKPKTIPPSVARPATQTAPVVATPHAAHAPVMAQKVGVLSEDTAFVEGASAPVPKATMTTSIATIAKRRGRPPKVK